MKVFLFHEMMKKSLFVSSVLLIFKMMVMIGLFILGTQ